MILQRIKESLFKTIYTPVCIVCGGSTLEIENHLCANCKARINLICVTAQPPINKYVSNVWTLASYDGSWLEVIHKFKYDRTTVAVSVVESFLSEHFQKISSNADLLIPVPLHWRRYLKRGYNQALVIANILKKITDLPIEKRVLRRPVYTPPQVGLSQTERRENIKGAFKVAKRLASKITGKNIVLVDDVMTTGATINECARVLKKAGANQVEVITLAKT